MDLFKLKYSMSFQDIFKRLSVGLRWAIIKAWILFSCMLKLLIGENPDWWDNGSCDRGLAQVGGREVCSVLPEVGGAHAAERGAGGQAVPLGDPVYPAEEPLPPLPALQHPCTLHEQHLPGIHSAASSLSLCRLTHTLTCTRYCSAASPYVLYP